MHRTPISNTCINAFAVIFADPQRDGYKFQTSFYSLLGSVGKLSAETNINFPAPPFNHISGICKNLVDAWPAATRVLSRGRKKGPWERGCHADCEGARFADFCFRIYFWLNIFGSRDKLMFSYMSECLVFMTIIHRPRKLGMWLLIR